MTSSPSLNEWNEATVAATQVLLGLISPNFRRVCLRRETDEWVLDFILQDDLFLDREEINDHACGMDAANLKYRIEVMASKDVLAFPQAKNIRVLYWRRE